MEGYHMKPVRCACGPKANPSALHKEISVKKIYKLKPQNVRQIKQTANVK